MLFLRFLIGLGFPRRKEHFRAEFWNDGRLKQKRPILSGIESNPESHLSISGGGYARFSDSANRIAHIFGEAS